MSDASLQEPPTTEMSPPTDYGRHVVEVLSRMTQTSGQIDQEALRKCIRLAESYMMTDVTMNVEGGIQSWREGFSRLVDVMVALHKRDELEWETVNVASKACSECWSAAGSWREMHECREGVTEIATRLRGLLDGNGKTYRGHPIYVP